MAEPGFKKIADVDPEARRRALEDVAGTRGHQSIERPATAPRQNAAEDLDELEADADVDVEALSGQQDDAEAEPTTRSRAGGRAKLTKANADHTPVSLSLKIPNYVRQQLKKRAAARDVTVTHLILQALADSGVTVYADDLMDDRRKKTK